MMVGGSVKEKDSSDIVFTLDLELDLNDLDSPFDQPKNIIQEGTNRNTNTTTTTTKSSFFSENEQKKRKTVLGGTTSGTRRNRLSVENILKQRQKRDALQREAQERIKRLKREVGIEDPNEDTKSTVERSSRQGRGGGHGKDSRDATQEDIDRRYEAALKKESDLVGVARMEEFAKQITSVIGEDEQEDPEPVFFSPLTQLTKALGVSSHPSQTKKESAATATAAAAGRMAPVLEQYRKSCEIYDVDFEESKDLLLAEVVSGQWLSGTLDTLQSMRGGEAGGHCHTNFDVEKCLIALTETDGTTTNANTIADTGRDNNNEQSMKYLLSHFATEVLCSSATCEVSSEFDEVAPSQSEVLEQLCGMLERCLGEGDGDSNKSEQEVSLAMMNTMKLVRVLLEEKWDSKDNHSWVTLPLSSDKRDVVAKVMCMLIQVCASKEGGLVYDSALSVAAHILSKIDLKATNMIADKVVPESSGPHIGRGKKKEGKRKNDGPQEDGSSVLYAHTRVLRDLFFEASANSTPTASENALQFIGRYTLAALSAFGGCTPSTQRKDFKGKQVSNDIKSGLLDLEEQIFEHISSKSYVIVKTALERDEHCGIWEFHDFLKMLDVYLFCLPCQVRTNATTNTSVSVLEGHTGYQRDLINFLNQIMKCFKKCQKESSRHCRVLASEMQTTYQLLFRSARTIS